MKCGTIDCPVHHEPENGREWEITPEGRVWSCCFFANGWDKRATDNIETQTLMSDQVILAAFEQDPNWNSLDHHTLAEILDHHVLKDYVYATGWLSDNPPAICVRECSIQTDSVTGVRKGKSDLLVKNMLSDGDE